MESVTSRDLSRVNTWARRYLIHEEQASLEAAAEYLALCASAEETARVLWWWNEGIRDYARNEEHIRELRELLITRAKELIS